MKKYSNSTFMLMKMRGGAEQRRKAEKACPDSKVSQNGFRKE